VETILEDSEQFPAHMRAKKKTKVEVKKEVGKEYDKVSIEKYDEMRKVREWDTLMCLATRFPKEEKKEVDDTRRDEKLEKRRMKMREELEEAKEQLWNHRNDEDFEERSKWIIDRTIKKIKDDIEKDYLKSLYDSRKNREELDPDKKLQLAKQLIDTVRYEEHHIIVPVDVHIQEIIADLDQKRYEEYLSYRTEISQERTRRILYESNQESDVENSQFEKRVIFIIPAENPADPMIYHMHRRCEDLSCTEYEEKIPCKLCFGKTEDILNSTIGSKMLGFVLDKVHYHDEDCQALLSERGKDTELRTVCSLCQEVDDIKRAIDESKQGRATGSNQHR
jgi:hypothetical protein